MDSRTLFRQDHADAAGHDAAGNAAARRTRGMAARDELGMSTADYLMGAQRMTIAEKLRFAADWLERHQIDSKDVLSAEATMFHREPRVHIDGDALRRALAGVGTLGVDDMGFVQAVLDGVKVVGEVERNESARREVTL